MNDLSLTALASITAIVGFIVGIATAYLRLFVNNQLLLLKERLMQEIDQKYVTIKLFEQEVHARRRRLDGDSN